MKYKIGQIYEYEREGSNIKKSIQKFIYQEDYIEVIINDKDNKEIAKSKIDYEDFEKIRDIKWYLMSCGYLGNDLVGLLHRFILNYPEISVVDHINRDKLDNRKSNLRIISHGANLVNSKVRKDSKSGLKGIRFRDDQKRNSPWQVTFLGKHKGYFKTQEEAIAFKEELDKQFWAENG